MSMRHRPTYNDKVNDNRRQNANGFVRGIVYDDGPSEVIVSFDDGLEYYDFEEFRYAWTDKFGGVFILAQESKVAQHNVDHMWEIHFLKHWKDVQNES